MLAYKKRSLLSVVLGLFLVVFYLPGNMGLVPDMVTSVKLSLLGEDVPTCQCSEETTCCGSSCCASKPKAETQSCCDSVAPYSGPTFDQHCTCGSQHRGGSAVLFTCSLHVVPNISTLEEPSFGSDAWLLFESRINSRPPNLPDPVPKSILSC
jgi:hypothetical protein